MPSRQYVNKLKPQASVKEIYRVVDKQLRANRQGNLYILMQLSDKTGQVSAMRWNASQGMFDAFDKGNFVHIDGLAQLYNGNMQLIVNDFHIVDAAKVDPSEFDQIDAETQEILWERLESLVDSLQCSQLTKIARSFLADAAIRDGLNHAPAGIKAHHAYAGGLLRHVVDIMTVADRVAACYDEVDRDLLLVGALLHDIGKIEELQYHGEMTYSDSGQLVGHLVQGVQMLDRQIQNVESEGDAQIDDEIKMRLQHMIVSHHGSLEHGSPRVPMTIEAIMLSAIDDMDAKLAAAVDLVETDRDDSNPWTAYNPTLGRKILKASVNKRGR